MSMPSRALPWPSDAPVLPVAPLRPTIDRFSSLALRFPADLEAIPGLAMGEEETAADLPPSLEQVADEFGGIRRHGITELSLLLEDRSDVGPYTLMGKATAFVPLQESPETAIVLSIDPDGAPGAVYGIGEDLALYLAAPDLAGWLSRVADALDASLAAIPSEEEDADVRAETAEQGMDERLYAEVLGMRDLEAMTTLPLQRPDAAGIDDLPAGTVAVADLREAPLGTRVDLVDADVEGDPLAHHVVFAHGGRVVCLVAD